MPSDIVSGLGIASLVLAVLGLLVGTVRVVRRQPGANSLVGLVVILAGLTGVGALFIVVFGPTPDWPILPILLGAGLVEFVLGLILWAVEARRDGFEANRSLGLLYNGLGVLLALMAIFVPLLPSQLTLEAATAALPTPTVAPSQPAQAASATEVPSATPASTDTPVPTNTPVNTQPPTATPTRERFMTATPTVTPTTAIVCGARVDYNVNMRLLPEPDAEVLAVIPYETVVEISGQTEAGDWWFTRYEDQWGWLDGEFISLDTDCARAPVFTP